MNKTLTLNHQTVTLEDLQPSGGSVRFTLNGHAYHFRSRRLENGLCVLEEELADGVWQAGTGAAWAGGKQGKTVAVGALEARISEAGAGAGASAATTAPSALSPVAPMPGLVRQVLVKKGDKVVSGQTLVVLEAMKLQLALPAGGDGVVDGVPVKEGDMVAEGAELVRLTPA
jgi:biotin carboxyl carrier protein